ncbi:hypothetical protein D0Z07_7150 [Hyphodiscus hymeniophilus]|uniref:Uncharacterized protein n=1 Tax=Hyphodiscus hymeniophilus TaxID=353542 RepID=A0A9P6VFY6_9HELO|nr:hypothetical protein D0Z07_7150 [Hyphodiscus hymeniophilus]
MNTIPPSSPLTSSHQPSSSTPSKRKRHIPPTPPGSSPSRTSNKDSTMRLNTNITDNIAIVSEEARTQGSPRTTVAYNFQGLQLEDGGTISKLELHGSNAPMLKPKDEAAMEEHAVRKRMKVFGAQDKSLSGRIMSDGTREVPETPDKRAFSIVIGAERTVDPVVVEKAKGVVLHNEIDPMIFRGGAAGKVKAGAGLARAYPSINRLSDSISRAPKPNKRSGTPPLFGSADASLKMEEGERRIVDEERAALTWHDDEITGHNPDDPDDDGEGINGIGFKPTPAMAYARTEKRRQQMLEYKNREAREARAKRSERRRASEVAKSNRDEEETARRVRFSEAEKSLISTM